MCFEFGELDERIGDRYEQTTKFYQIGNGSWRWGFEGRDGGQCRYRRVQFPDNATRVEIALIAWVP